MLFRNWNRYGENGTSTQNLIQTYFKKHIRNYFEGISPAMLVWKYNEWKSDYQFSMYYQTNMGENQILLSKSDVFFVNNMNFLNTASI